MSHNVRLIVRIENIRSDIDEAVSEIDEPERNAQVTDIFERYSPNMEDLELNVDLETSVITLVHPPTDAETERSI